MPFFEGSAFFSKNRLRPRLHTMRVIKHVIFLKIKLNSLYLYISDDMKMFRKFL